MDEPMPKLKNPPIVEAVLDIECDMPPGQDVAALERTARDGFQRDYPSVQQLYREQHRIEMKIKAEPKMSTEGQLHGFRFIKEDQTQLVQLRADGFSFNRLAPYSSLDDYLSEIERTWNVFVSIASPVQVRLMQLTYINRIHLPMTRGRLQLEDYLRVCPRLPDEERLEFVGFLNQHAAVEKDTGNEVNIILTAQPAENEILPIIFNISAARRMATDPKNWDEILNAIFSLRALKNRVFRNTLTEACIKLFQE